MKDLIGKRFGRLTVLCYVGYIGHNSYWKCKCDCGEEVNVRGDHIQRGETKSCGCYNIEKQKETHTVHGYARTKEYRAWSHIKGRCYNVKDAAYKNYGGRGIRVCDRWLESFENFISDMGKCPRGFTIERINNDRDYSPDNCIWATRLEQGNNKRNNIYVEYDNKNKTITGWSKETGIKRSVIYKRLRRFNWTIERTLTTPTGGRNESGNKTL